MSEKMLIPTEYFVTSGVASSTTSDLNAFDRALAEAGIEEQNLVAVSSIIPPMARKVNKKRLPMGAITHCVLSRVDGLAGETISAGIAYAFRIDGQGGYVVEDHAHASKNTVEKNLVAKIKDMETLRGVKLSEPVVLVKGMTVPNNSFGCCVVSLVFSEYKV